MPSKKPTCTVNGPSGRIIINKEDLENYKGRGYTLVGEETAAGGHETEDLKDLTVAQLKQKAEDLGIELASNAKKDQIVEAIESHLTDPGDNGNGDTIDD